MSRIFLFPLKNSDRHARGHHTHVKPIKYKIHGYYSDIYDISKRKKYTMMPQFKAVYKR